MLGSILRFLVWMELRYWKVRIHGDYTRRCYYGNAVDAYVDGDLGAAQRWLRRFALEP